MSLFASPASHQGLAFTVDRLRLLLAAAQLPGRARSGWAPFGRDEMNEVGIVNKMQDAFPVWGQAMGVLERYPSQENSREVGPKYQLTAFGRALSESDPTIQTRASLWLLHYHLSSPCGPGFAFLNGLFGGTYPLGSLVSQQQVAEILFVAAPAGSLKSFGHAQRHVTHILRAYTAVGWPLARLQVIERIEDPQNTYKVGASPVPIDLWEFTYALLDQWERAWGGNMTVALDRLYESGGLANILFLSPQRIEEYLGQLEHEGWLSVYRTAPPYQLAARWDDITERKLEALKRAYAR